MLYLFGASAASPTLVVKTENCLYIYMFGKCVFCMEEVIDVRTRAIIGRSYTETKLRRYWVMPLKGKWSPPYPATEKWSSIVNPRLCKG